MGFQLPNDEMTIEDTIVSYLKETKYTAKS